jgi:hypothetical protein
LTPASLTEAIKACASEVWKREALRQDALGDEALVSYAAAIELAVERGQLKLAERAEADRIRAASRSDVCSGVTGTPTCFLNGRHNGAFDQQSLADAGIMAMSPPRDSEGHEHYRRHLGERRERKDSP